MSVMIACVALSGLSSHANGAQDEIPVVIPACNPDFEPAASSFPFLDQSPNYDLSEDVIIGDIHYTQLQIFDETNPDENNWLFRWANNFHIMTREQTVAQQILFSEGENFDPRLLQETSRLLRKQGYFFDTESRIVSLCNDRADIEVITRDTWSLTPAITFDRSGGNNTYSVLLEDSNILGLGNQMAISASRELDRTSREIIYKDNNLWGTRYSGELYLTDSDDGHRQLMAGGLPFFELESRRSWRVRYERNELDQPQYFKSEKQSEVHHTIEDYSFRYGISNGLENDWVTRWYFGYRYRDDRFETGDEYAPPQVFPRDQKMSFPFVQLEMIEDNYITALNVNQIYRTEDLHLGKELTTMFGIAPKGLGSDRDRLYWTGAYADTLFYDGRKFLQHTLDWEAKWNMDSQSVEDLVLNYDLSYLLRRNDRRSFYVDLRTTYSRNLNTHRQITLGGLNGSRAFESRFQIGDRSINISIEERVYSDLHIFNLIRVGGAVFLDIGRAWEPGVDSQLPDDWLAGAGFGLRLGSSKASSNRIAHLDFAFPLTNGDDPAVDNYLIAFNVKSAF